MPSSGSDTFGFSPKISTTVENAVEKPGVLPSSALRSAVLLVFLAGETAATSI
jgi:hypothetical protein